jgi:hypothetical protein
MVHTVDGAAALLSSTAAFPSRVSVSRGSAAHFPNLARRLYRCLSHAWKHHPEAFAAFERDTRCAARLTALCRAHGLLAEDQLLIPAADLGL